MLTFIVNPAAGNQHALKVQSLLKQELDKRGIECRFVRTEKPGHATDLARQAASADDCTGVVSVGGDGTAFEVACGLMNTGVPMGIIPAGTGNALSRQSASPRSPWMLLSSS